MQRFALHVRKALTAVAGAVLFVGISSATLAAPFTEKTALRSSKADTVGSWGADATIDIVGGDKTGMRVKLLPDIGPADIKGAGVLVHEDMNANDVRRYLPTLGKTKRVVASNGDVLLSLLVYALAYCLVFGAGVLFMVRLVKVGPAVLSAVPEEPNVGAGSSLRLDADRQ
jgi:hypothetical protein